MKLIEFINGKTRILTSMRGRDLRGAIFKGNALDGEDFSEADLSGAVFDGARLRGALFRNSDVSNASFVEANIEHADFQGASFDNTDFTGAITTEDTSSQLPRQKVYAFDFDDNILNMPTVILFTRKPTSPEAEPWLSVVPVSTDTHAKVREKVGTNKYKAYYRPDRMGGAMETDSSDPEAIEIDYKDYFECLEDGPNNAFRFFSDSKDKNYMLDDAKKILGSDLGGNLSNLCEDVLGPSFSDVIKACRTMSGASNTYIITARSQSPETIYEVLSYLHSLGVIGHIPPLSNIHPVNYESNEGETTQELKLSVICSILDELSENGNISNSFGFSDDDPKTFETVRRKLSEQMRQGRWSKNLAISLFYTGESYSEQPKKQRTKSLVRLK